MEIELKGEKFILCYEKCLYRHHDKSLIISDVHFGKINHFRKAGIGIPYAATGSSIDALQKVVSKYKPEKVVFLGDLFHSTYNNSVDAFRELLMKNSDIEYILVKGNHDIMQEHIYTNMMIKCVDYIVDEQFIFSHDKLLFDTPQQNIYGHIHPGVLLKGKARQSSRFPCFFVSDKDVILPAFGNFTGLQIIKPTLKDKVYITINEKVIAI